jgi:hypothetical protein
MRDHLELVRVDRNDALDVWRYRVVKQTRVARDLDSDFVFLPSFPTPTAAIICLPLNGVPSITMSHSFNSPSGRSISSLSLPWLA